eukprot:1239383-Pleurochrysis_carterae.AAC.5
MKRYRHVELTPLAATTEAEAEVEAELAQTRLQAWLDFTWRKLNALLWITVAAGIAIFVDLVPVVQNGYPPARPHRHLDRCAAASPSIALFCMNAI